MRLKMDINDPANPFGRVNTVEIVFKARYSGQDAWNQNILIPKLEALLKGHGYTLREYNATQYWDVGGKEITKEELQDYIGARHGHATGRCSNCPDPVKWKEAERLARRIQQEEGRGLSKKKKQRVRTVYILETEEERALRKKVENKDIKIDYHELVKGGGNRIEEV